MIYKGYEGVLEVDEESGELSGTVAGLRDVVTFVGATVEEARALFERSVELLSPVLRRGRQEAGRPYAGKFLVRVAPETHRELERHRPGPGVHRGRGRRRGPRLLRRAAGPAPGAVPHPAAMPGQAIAERLRRPAGGAASGPEIPGVDAREWRTITRRTTDFVACYTV